MKIPFFVFSAVLVLGFAAIAQEVPKEELFLGYQYLRFNPSLSSSANKSFNMNGGGGAVTFNFSKYVGLKAEFTDAGAGNMTVCDSTGLKCLTRSGNFFTYLFGPQIAMRSKSRVTPFVHVLFGGSHSNFYANLQQSGTISTGPTVQDATKEAFTLAVGGGLDVKVGKNVAIRLGQFDYFMTRFSGRYIDTSGTGSAGGLEINNQNNFRFLAGVVFHIGRRNILPPSVTCSASKPSIIEGETTTIQAKASDPESGALTYSWRVSGGRFVGSGETITFDSTSLAPGKYSATVTASDGKFSTSCTADVAVEKRYLPPTVRTEPPTASIMVGESAAIRAVANSPDGSPLTYSWTVNGQQQAATGTTFDFGTAGRQPGNYTVAVTVNTGKFTASASSAVTVRELPIPAPTIECQTPTLNVESGSTTQLSVRAVAERATPTVTWSATGGTVTGSGQSATFNATALSAGTYTVTAMVDNGRGGRASCTTTVNVSQKSNVPGFAASQFRVNNVAKAILDNIAVQMKNNPQLRASVAGYTDGSKREATVKGLGQKRAQAAVDYLVSAGVDASRFTATDGGVSTVGDSKTEAGRKENRRAEIELSVR
jgi:outer membrane protein OmpA-like peptidoglycan-associated protein